MVFVNIKLVVVVPFPEVGVIEKLAIGFVRTVIMLEADEVLEHPFPSVTVKVILYWPEAVYIYVGFDRVEVDDVPLPRFHAHETPTGDEVFVKFTRCGAQPELSSIVKLTTGNVSTVNVKEPIAGELPQLSVTVIE